MDSHYIVRHITQLAAEYGDILDLERRRQHTHLYCEDNRSTSGSVRRANLSTGGSPKSNSSGGTKRVSHTPRSAAPDRDIELEDLRLPPPRLGMCWSPRGVEGVG